MVTITKEEADVIVIMSGLIGYIQSCNTIEEIRYLTDDSEIISNIKLFEQLREKLAN